MDIDLTKSPESHCPPNAPGELILDYLFSLRRLILQDVEPPPAFLRHAITLLRTQAQAQAQDRPRKPKPKSPPSLDDLLI